MFSITDFWLLGKMKMAMMTMMVHAMPVILALCGGGDGGLEMVVEVMGRS